MNKYGLKQIHVVYFSAAGTTKTIAEFIGNKLAEKLELPLKTDSYTFPEERCRFFSFESSELLIWATPVYAGRIPNKTVDYVREALKGNHTLSIPVAVYGNRNYDNALSELTGIMKDNGCQPIAAAAVAARHAFSQTLGAGKPDEKDYKDLEIFCEKVSDMLLQGTLVEGSLTVPGEEHPKKYYTPRREDGEPAKFLKAFPKVRDYKCMSCETCVRSCPMGTISFVDGLPSWSGTCIKCQACIRKCPTNALYFDDADFLSHVKMIEKNFAEPKALQTFFIS